MRNRVLATTLVISLCAISIPAQAESVVTEPKMKLIKTINGAISPKSVRSSGDGVVSAHNMMYRHSVTVYDAKTFELLKTIPDSVSLQKFGFSKSTSIFKGSPVEGTFSPDGKFLYVSNYAMYGPGYNKEGMTLVHLHPAMTKALCIESIEVITRLMPSIQLVLSLKL